MSLRPSHLVIVGVMVVASGLVHGWWTNRWVSAGPLKDGRNLLEHEVAVGDWQPGPFLDAGREDVPAGCQVVSRNYTSQRSGKTAVVSVTCGHAGIVAVHTPDVCYLGSGYKLKSDVRQETFALANGTSASCYVADFQKSTATGTERIRVRWTWSEDGTWQAPDYPRWYFARAPILYKLYVVHPLSEDDLTHDEPYRNFVTALLPTLSRQIVR